MADETIIIEGSVKFRDGKKWKSRWCVMRKLSPVADCVELQLYRSGCGGGGGGGRGARVASLPLERWVGSEAGFTLDRQPHALALVCRARVIVLALESRARLTQWQGKLAAVLGAATVYSVLVAAGGGAGGRGDGLPAGAARLLLRGRRAALTAGCPPRLLAAFELQHLRRYGVVGGRFCFEGGSACGRAEGLHVLVTEQARDILRDVQLAARGELAPRPRSVSCRRTEVPDVDSPPGEASWVPPRAGAEDTASVRKLSVSADGGEGVALERCVSCMSKLGALSRSSTAALTPGARHFSPSWTMDPLTEPPSRCDVISQPGDVTPQAGACTTLPRAGDVTAPARPARPARLELPRSCSCHVIGDGESSAIGPYENYDVPRVPSAEVEGEYYDTPKRLRECLDNELFRITRSSTANSLILKKPCGCLLKFGKKRREPTVVDADEELRAPACACTRVTQWMTCRRAPPALAPTPAPAATSDKENVTPDAAALYATVDFSRKTRRKTLSGETVEIDNGPLAHYENLNFALSLEYYENAKDLLRKAGVTQSELNAISANLKPMAFSSESRGACAKCKHPAKTPSATRANDDYLMMEPNALEGDQLERSRAPPAGYTPMSPLAGFAFHTLRQPKSPLARLSDEKSASNPALCGARGTDTRRHPRGRPRASSADSSRFLDDVKEFDGSGSAGSASSLETLRGAAGGGGEGRAGEDSSAASPGRPPPPAASNRDSSSSNDSGVSSWSPRRPAPPPRPHSTDAPRVSVPSAAGKSSSAEAEVPVHALRPSRACVGVDSRSTSSGASDMSDYIETLSLCSSHSSSDTPVTMRARVTSTLRPRSGREYARLSPACATVHSCAALRGHTDTR